MLILLLSVQAFGLTEDEGIRLLRKTYSYVDGQLLEALKNKSRLEAATYLVEKKGSTYNTVWRKNIEDFNASTLCLRNKVPGGISCEKEKAYYEDKSYQVLKELYLQIDIKSVGNAKNKIIISKDLTKKEFLNLINTDKNNRALINGINIKASNKNLSSSYADHVLQSDNFFYENLVLFWSNHFVTTRKEVKDYLWVANQNNLIRKMMLSSFKEFVKLITIDPAMIKYLNLDENHCVSKRKKYDCSSVNENYSRELLELFTLGANPETGEPICYTEKDIETIAKSLTGHTANKASKKYIYKRQRSDYKVLEKKYPVKSAFLEKCDAKELGAISAVTKTHITDTDSLIEVLFDRRGKQIARHITGKLYKHFVASKVDWNDKGLQKIALRFSKDFDLKALTIGLLSLDAIYKDSSKNTIIKSPAELYFGTLKQFDLKESKSLSRQMINAKQGFFLQPDVKGWRTGKGWIDTASFAARTLFVRRALGQNKEKICESVNIKKIKKYMLEGQQVTKHSVPKNIKTCNRKINILKRIAADPIYQVK